MSKSPENPESPQSENKKSLVSFLKRRSNISKTQVARSLESLNPNYFKSLERLKKSRQVYKGLEYYSSAHFVERLFRTYELWSEYSSASGSSSLPNSRYYKFLSNILETSEVFEITTKKIDSAEGYNLPTPTKSEDQKIKINSNKKAQPFFTDEYVVGDISDPHNLMMNLLISGVAIIEKPFFKFYDLIADKDVIEIPHNISNQEIWQRYRIIPNVNFNNLFDKQIIFLGNMVDDIYSDEILITLLSLAKKEKEHLYQERLEYFRKDLSDLSLDKELAQNCQEYYRQNKKLIITLGDKELFALIFPDLALGVSDYIERVESFLNRGGTKIIASAIRKAIQEELITAVHLGKNGIFYSHAFLSKKTLEILQKDLRKGLAWESEESKASAIISKVDYQLGELSKIQKAINYLLQDRSNESYNSPDYQSSVVLIANYLNRVIKLVATDKRYDLRNTVYSDSGNSVNPIFRISESKEDVGGIFSSQTDPVNIMGAIGNIAQDNPRINEEGIFTHPTSNPKIFTFNLKSLPDIQSSTFSRPSVNIIKGYNIDKEQGTIISYSMRYQDKLFPNGEVPLLNIPKEGLWISVDASFSEVTNQYSSKARELLNENNKETYHQVGKELLNLLKTHDLSELAFAVKEESYKLSSLDNKGNNILHVLSYQNYPHHLHLILSSPIDNIDAPNQDGFSALAISIISGNPDATKILLHYDADPANVGGCKASEVLLPFLKKETAFKDNKEYRQYLLSVEKSARMVELQFRTKIMLLDYQVKEEKKSSSPKEDQENYPEEFLRLINTKKNSNPIKSRCLELRMVKLLDHMDVDQVSNLRNEEEHIFYSAVKKGYTEVILAMERKMKPEIINGCDSKGNSPLHIAAKNSDSEMLKWLLILDLNPNRLNKSGQTPLYIVMQNGDIQSVEILLKYSADIVYKITNETDSKLIDVRKIPVNNNVSEKTYEEILRLIDDYIKHQTKNEHQPKIEEKNSLDQKLLQKSSENSEITSQPKVPLYSSSPEEVVKDYVTSLNDVKHKPEKDKENLDQKLLPKSSENFEITSQSKVPLYSTQASMNQVMPDYLKILNDIKKRQAERNAQSNKEYQKEIPSGEPTTTTAQVLASNLLSIKK